MYLVLSSLNGFRQSLKIFRPLFTSCDGRIHILFEYRSRYLTTREVSRGLARHRVKVLHSVVWAGETVVRTKQHCETMGGIPRVIDQTTALRVFQPGPEVCQGGSERSIAPIEDFPPAHNKGV